MKAWKERSWFVSVVGGTNGHRLLKSFVGDFRSVSRVNNGMSSKELKEFLQSTERCSKDKIRQGTCPAGNFITIVGESQECHSRTSRLGHSLFSSTR